QGLSESTLVRSTKSGALRGAWGDRRHGDGARAGTHRLGGIALPRPERRNEHAHRTVRERPGGNAEVVLTSGDEIMAGDAPPPPGHREHELRRACLPCLQG